MRYPVIYSDKYVSEGAAGTTRGPVIFIRPAYRDDEGLYQHELVHVTHFWLFGIVSALLISAVAPTLTPIGFGVYSALYMTVPRFRLWEEVQAYRRQLRYCEDDRARKFAYYITAHYGLDVDINDVEEMLRA